MVTPLGLKSAPEAYRLRQMNTAKLLLTLIVLSLYFQAPAAVSRSGRILFSSNRSGAWRLWLIKADGSDLKQLTAQDSDDQDVDPMFNDYSTNEPTMDGTASAILMWALF